MIGKTLLLITIELDSRLSNLYKRMALLFNDGIFKEEYATQQLEVQHAYLMNVFAIK